MIKKILGGVAAVVLAVWAFFALKPEPAYQPYQPPQAYASAAMDYLEANLAPMPEGWTFDYYTAADGAKLRFGHVAASGPTKATLVFVPGFASTLDLYGDIFSDLSVRGYEIYGFDLRGQGGSARMLKNPEKPWVKDFGDYSDDLAGFIAQLRQTVSGPLVLMGESFGAHVSLRAEQDHTLPIEALVLMVPALQVNTYPYSQSTARAIVGTMRGLGFGKSYAVNQNNWQPWEPDLTKDNPCSTNVARAHLKDSFYNAYPDMRVGGTTNQWIAEIMQSGLRITAADELAKVKVPVTVLTATDDMIVSSDAAKQACSALGDCTEVDIEGARHCMLFESDAQRETIYQAIDMSVEKVLK